MITEQQANVQQCLSCSVSLRKLAGRMHFSIRERWLVMARSCRVSVGFAGVVRSHTQREHNEGRHNWMQHRWELNTGGQRDGHSPHTV